MENVQNYQAPSLGTSVLGILAGGAVNNLVSAPPPQIVGKKLIEKIGEISTLNDDEFKQVGAAIDKAVEKSGISNLEVVRFSESNKDNITKFLKEDFKLNAPFYPKVLTDTMAKIYTEMVEKGMNAFYSFSNNKIVLPENKIQLTAFHELGHALNKHKSTLGKILQKSRLANVLSLPILFCGLGKTQKAPGQKPEGTFDKITTFIKDHAGILSFTTFLPMLSEEAMASIKGCKIAKEVLNPELAAKVTKTNKVAYLSYLTLALASSIGVFAGVKVKDMIAKPQLVKAEK